MRLLYRVECMYTVSNGDVPVHEVAARELCSAKIHYDKIKGAVYKPVLTKRRSYKLAKLSRYVFRSYTLSPKRKHVVCEVTNNATIVVRIDKMSVPCDSQHAR